MPSPPSVALTPSSSAVTTRLSHAELAFIAIVVLAFGSISILVGKDEGWDFRNYHWYDAYAFLHARLGFDVAVAHHATYFNPLIHLPFYWLATAGTSWLALFYVGALYGLNVLPLYLLARSALTRLDNRLLAAVLALAGLFGSTVISALGKTSYDTVVSALVFGGLAVLIIKRDALCAAAAPAAAAAARAGLLIGAATGLKLVEGFYAVGFALVLLLLPGRPAVRTARLLAGGAAGTAAVVLCAGFWFVTLERATGNPLFPFYNSVFRSPLIDPTFFGSTNFLPVGFWSALSFPFRFLLDYRIADDAPFRDFRIPLLYVLLPVATVWFAVARPRSARLVAAPTTRILFLFAVGSYAAWLASFAVYRYLAGLEMLAPLLIVAALDCAPLPQRLRLAALAILLLMAALFGHYGFGDHAAVRDPYVQVEGLSFPDPAGTMLLMTGHEPMAYLLPSLPPAIPVLRIDGWLAQPDDGSGLTALMRARVAAHRGDLFLLAAPEERTAADRATTAYGLEIVTAQCREIRSNLGGPYQLCPLQRSAHQPEL
ncbi:MAG: hypothetical protein JWO04_5274 [Gammaproteobacteria bacterium]|nr:hypothetical protein [Gammaproteobacteria bacterium]